MQSAHLPGSWLRPDQSANPNSIGFLVLSLESKQAVSELSERIYQSHPSECFALSKLGKIVESSFDEFCPTLCLMLGASPLNFYHPKIVLKKKTNLILTATESCSVQVAFLPTPA